MTLVWIGIAVIAGAFLVGLLLNVLESITFFKKELRRINNEIGRTEGKEQERWKRRKKRLLLSLIPFVRY